MTEIEMSHLVRKTTLSTSMTMCGSVLWHRPSRGYHACTMHRVSMGLGDVTVVAVLDQVVIELVSSVLRIWDSRPRIRVSTRIVGGQLLPTVTVADSLTFPAVEASVDECHVRGLVNNVTDSRLMVHGEGMERGSLSIQRMVDSLRLEKMISIFSRTRCSMTLLVGPLYIRTARGGLKGVVRTLSILPVLLRRSLGTSWDGDGDHDSGRRKRGDSKRPAQLHNL